MKNKILRFVRSKPFRRATFVFAFVYLVVAFFFSIRPGPFFKFGLGGLFFFNLVGGPGMLLVPFASLRFPFILVALVSSLGMALNDCVSWWVGMNASDIFTHSKNEIRIQNFLKKYGMLGLFTLAVAPTPYDFAGLIAGYLRFPFFTFLFVTFLGRFIRFSLIGLFSIHILT